MLGANSLDRSYRGRRGGGGRRDDMKGGQFVEGGKVVEVRYLRKLMGGRTGARGRICKGRRTTDGGC